MLSSLSLSPHPSLLFTLVLYRAACAAGGNLEPYNPTWAPYPIHSWPDSGTGSCKQMQAHATYIQTENDAQIAQIQNTMNQMNC